MQSVIVHHLLSSDGVSCIELTRRAEKRFCRKLIVSIVYRAAWCHVCAQRLIRLRGILRILCSLRLSWQESVCLYILDVCALMRHSAASFLMPAIFLDKQLFVKKECCRKKTCTKMSLIKAQTSSM